MQHKFVKNNDISSALLIIIVSVTSVTKKDEVIIRICKTKWQY
jgi:hypothetical protein